MKHNIIAVLSGTLLLASLSFAATSPKDVLKDLSGVEKVAKEGRAALDRGEYVSGRLDIGGWVSAHTCPRISTTTWTVSQTNGRI